MTDDPLCPECNHPASKHEDDNPFNGNCRYTKTFKSRLCGCPYHPNDIINPRDEDEL